VSIDDLQMNHGYVTEIQTISIEDGIAQGRKVNQLRPQTTEVKYVQGSQGCLPDPWSKGA